MTGQPYAGAASSPASHKLPEAKADSERVVTELASRVGTLGIEVADIAGNLEEVTSRISNQAAQFEELEQSVARIEERL
jgi:methyl-accepting chemotaxis protein